MDATTSHFNAIFYPLSTRVKYVLLEHVDAGVNLRSQARRCLMHLAHINSETLNFAQTSQPFVATLCGSCASP